MIARFFVDLGYDLSATTTDGQTAYDIAKKKKWGGFKFTKPKKQKKPVAVEEAKTKVL